MRTRAFALLRALRNLRQFLCDSTCPPCSQICLRPSFFSDADVVDVVKAVFAQKSCSDLGKLEAITNLLKPSVHRKTVWSQEGVGNLVFNVEWDQAAPLVYRCVFGIWMLSFNTDLINNLDAFQPVRKLKTIMLHSRVEKAFLGAPLHRRNMFGDIVRFSTGVRFATGSVPPLMSGYPFVSDRVEKFLAPERNVGSDC